MREHISHADGCTPSVTCTESYNQYSNKRKLRLKRSVQRMHNFLNINCCIFGTCRISLKTFDCFRAQKENALKTAYKISRLVLTHTNEFYGKPSHTPDELKKFFHRLLKVMFL